MKKVSGEGNKPLFCEKMCAIWKDISKPSFFSLGKGKITSSLMLMTAFTTTSPLLAPRQ
jgi:hypothetical protein